MTGRTGGLGKAGGRVSQTVNGDTTDYVIDADNATGYAQVLEERDGTTGDVEKTYNLGHDVIAQQAPEIENGDTLYILPDGHGSTLRFAQ